MPSPVRPDEAHDEAEILLPWYVTGQLDPAEHALVERHLAACLSCQRQIALEHRMVEQVRSLTPEIESGWAELRRRIEPQATRPAIRPRKTANALEGLWNMLRQPAVAAFAVAQL